MKSMTTSITLIWHFLVFALRNLLLFPLRFLSVAVKIDNNKNKPE